MNLNHVTSRNSINVTSRNLFTLTPKRQFSAAATGTINATKEGKTVRSERLEYFKTSPHYKDPRFRQLIRPDPRVTLETEAPWTEFYDEPSLRDLRASAELLEKWGSANYCSSMYTLESARIPLNEASEQRRARLRTLALRQLRFGVSRFGACPSTSLDATASSLTLCHWPTAIRPEHIDTYLEQTVARLVASTTTQDDKKASQTVEVEDTKPTGPTKASLGFLESIRIVQEIQKSENEAQSKSRVNYLTAAVEDAKRVRDLERQAESSYTDFDLNAEKTPFQVRWDFFAATHAMWNLRLDRPANFDAPVNSVNTSTRFIALILLLLSGSYVVKASIETTYFKYSESVRFAHFIPAGELALFAGVISGIGMRQDLVAMARRRGAHSYLALLFMGLSVISLSAGLSDYRRGLYATATTNALALWTTWLATHRGGHNQVFHQVKLLPPWVWTYFGRVWMVNLLLQFVVLYKAPLVLGRAETDLLHGNLSDKFSMTTFLKRMMGKANALPVFEGFNAETKAN